MEHPWKALIGMVCCACAALLAGGCGKGGADIKGVKVDGKVVSNGQPLKFLKDEEVKVSFAQEVAKGEKSIGSAADVNPEDGTFTIPGPTKHGIPPGKYRVRLSSQPYGGGKDRFEPLFDPEDGPPLVLIAEVGPEEGQSFVIDVARRSIKKQ
jgi:hypothetical protein